MVKLSVTSVIDHFRQLSGCSTAEVTNNLFLINNACHIISGLIDEKKCTLTDVHSAEYAASAVAFYDYICKLNAAEKIICSLTGKASANEDYKSRIESARQLKESALEAIKPVTLSADFLFSTMEG